MKYYVNFKIKLVWRDYYPERYDDYGYIMPDESFVSSGTYVPTSWKALGRIVITPKLAVLLKNYWNL